MRETKEEILKECTEGLLKCSVTYNMSHKGILQAMNVYSNQCQEKLTARILELEAHLCTIHDIVDKHNFDEGSQLAEIYKITHNSF